MWYVLFFYLWYQKYMVLYKYFTPVNLLPLYTHLFASHDTECRFLHPKVIFCFWLAFPSFRRFWIWRFRTEWSGCVGFVAGGGGLRRLQPKRQGRGLNLEMKFLFTCRNTLLIHRSFVRPRGRLWTSVSFFRNQVRHKVAWIINFCELTHPQTEDVPAAVCSGKCWVVRVRMD